MERYHNKQLADLFQKQYFEDAIAYQTMIFQHLMQAKILKSGNPKTTAIQFYAPIFLLLELCDSRAAFEREAIALLQEHIRQFLKLNSIKQTAGN